MSDHHVFAICSDGDFEEGISHEAASLAGHLGLGRLVYVYDDNHISIDGPTELAYTDDVPKRFEAYGWHVVQLGEVANDLDALEAGLRAGIAEDDRPTLVVLRSHIGWPSPKYTDTAHAHGNPLGADEVAKVKEILGLPAEDFCVPDDVLELYRAAGRRGTPARDEWRERVAAWSQRTPRRPPSTTRASPGAASKAGRRSCRPGRPGDKLATRVASGKVLGAIFDVVPGLVGGGADLSGNTGTLVEGAARDHRRRRERPPHPLRYPRARDGLDHERHVGVGHAAVRRHVLRVLRLHAPGGAPRRDPAGEGRVRLDARLDRCRSRRPDAPAGRAARGDPRDPAPARDPPGRRQRGRAGVARAHRRRRPDRDRAHPPDGAGRRRHGRARGRRRLPQGAYVLVDEPRPEIDLVLIGTGSEVSICARAREALVARRALGARRVDAVVGPLRGAARRGPGRGAAARRADARGRGGVELRLVEVRRRRRRRSTASASRRPATSRSSASGSRPSTSPTAPARCSDSPIPHPRCRSRRRCA